MKIGGRILWNALPTCETFKISCLMGRLHTKDVFGKPFQRTIIPFGSLVEYHPITAKDQSRIHQFGKESLTWIVPRIRFVRGRIWKGDITVADIEEFETMDASEIYSKRLNAKEVIFHQKMLNSFFPAADGRIKIYWRRSGTENIHLDTGTTPFEEKVKEIFFENQKGLFLHHLKTHFRMPMKQETIFWSMSGNFIYRHHVEPRVKLYSPREESFPIPLKYIDVSRTTHTNLDVTQESRIDDHWNIDGSRDLSDSWTGFTQFTLLSEKPPEG